MTPEKAVAGCCLKLASCCCASGYALRKPLRPPETVFSPVPCERIPCSSRRFHSNPSPLPLALIPLAVSFDCFRSLSISFDCFHSAFILFRFVCPRFRSVCLEVRSPCPQLSSPATKSPFLTRQGRFPPLSPQNTPLKALGCRLRLKG